MLQTVRQNGDLFYKEGLLNLRPSLGPSSDKAFFPETCPLNLKHLPDQPVELLRVELKLTVSVMRFLWPTNCQRQKRGRKGSFFMSCTA